MMNVSQLLTSLKMDLGIYGIALPFEDEDKVIFETLKLKTIKTFSQFSPYILRTNLNLEEMVCLQSNYQESVYELPNVFGDRRLLGLRKITPRNKLLGNGYVNPMFDDTFDAYMSLMTAQSNANLYSIATPSFTFRFQHPNLLYLFNTSSMANEIVVEFMLEHTENLATIPNTSWESFYELALIDMKKFMFNTVKHYRELQTAYGNINLKIDDWENADSDRKELIEKWRDVYHLDMEQFVIV